MEFTKRSIIVEVKTTDAYRIDLNTIATYRRKLVDERRVSEVNSSILIVVGRSDAGDLEAQVRGSRHAWDIRLISIDSLLRLMKLKEELDDPGIIEKIRRVLTPQEFTKVDGIIDLVFSTAKDVKKEQEPASEDIEDDEQDDTKPKFTPVNFRDACSARVARCLKQPLIKRSAAAYSSPDEKLVLICINSREYKKSSDSGFWFAFHPHQREFLKSGVKAYVALGCGSPGQILLIPASDFSPWLDQCNMTKLEDRAYWHVQVKKTGVQYLLRQRKGAAPVKLTKYLLP